MIKKVVYFLLLGVLGLCIAYAIQPLKKGKGVDETVYYEEVYGWLHLPDSIHLGNPTGIAIDTAQRLVVFHRAERKWPLIGAMPHHRISSNTVLFIDRTNGRLLRSWGAGMFIMPHGLSVDRANNIWVTDVGLHQVFKFDEYGRLLLQIGVAGVSGKDAAHFDRPTDVAVSKDGSFYVSDGYRNSRIVKFSANGQYLFEWGKKGNGPGQFNIPHGICIDDQEKLYVADRENDRIQVFDSSGRFLHEWNKGFASVCAIDFNPHQQRFVATDDLRFLQLIHRGADVLLLDSAGTVRSRFGRSGMYNGPVTWLHDAAMSNEGIIYAGDIRHNTIRQFRKKSIATFP